MAGKTIKCTFLDCRKDILKTEAYVVVTMNKAGIPKNNYYCSKEEYDERKRELIYMDEFKDFVISDLLGHGKGEGAWNIVLNTLISTLKKDGYLYSQMYYCILKCEKAISSKIAKIKTDTAKVTYLMAIVKRRLEEEEKGVAEIFNVDIDLLNKLNTEDYKIVNDNTNILDFLN